MVLGLRTVSEKLNRNLHQEEIEEEEQEEEEEEATEEEEDEEEETSPVPMGKRGPPCSSAKEEQGKRRCTRPCSLDLGAIMSHLHQTEMVTFNV